MIEAFNEIYNNTDILKLAQKWLSGTIDDQEFDILNNWYYALESVQLGFPDEFTVERVEKWLHKQYFKLPSEEQRNSALPPWNSLQENK